MPDLNRTEMAEGTYVFESFPTALSDKWPIYRDLKSIQQPKFGVKYPIICENTEYLRPKRKPTRVKKFSGGYLSNDIPPVAGRLHVDIQTDLYLEELVDRVELIDKCTQTDDFLNRPATPFFIPQKSGIDVSTQVYEADVFYFDLEVRPVLEVLVTKTIEQALLEVMEEEELANIRCEINHQGELRAAYLNEIMRREEQNKRYREEFERRYKEARDLLALKLETAKKIITNQFVKRMLEPLMPSSFENLYVNGYFRDPVELDLRNNFMKELLLSTVNKIHPTYRAYLVIDGLIRDAVNGHIAEYSDKV